MNIVIAGGGSVGLITAEYFSREGHNVTIIEHQETVVRRIQQQYDVSVVHGAVTDGERLQEAGVAEADLFLALTDNDEANIVSCSFAKTFGAAYCITRVNEVSHTGKESAEQLKNLGIDTVLDTEGSLIHQIDKLIQYPGAADIQHFMERKMVVGLFTFSKNSQWYGATLGDIAFPVPVTPLAYAKVGEMQPFDPNTYINEFVYVYYACRSEDLEQVHKTLYGKPSMQRAMVYGGGFKTDTAVVELVERLGERGISEVTVVTDRQDHAEMLSGMIDHNVVFGDPSDPQFATMERFQEYDVYIAFSKNFEKNLFSSVVAYSKNTPHTISLVRHPEHVNMVTTIPLTAFSNPAMVTANKVMKYHKIESIVSREIMTYGQNECVEVLLSDDSQCVGNTVDALPFVDSKVVAIARDEELVTVTPETVFEQGDRVLLFVVDTEKNGLHAML